MKILFSLLHLAVCDPILTIPTTTDRNGRIVTTEQVSVIDGQSIGPMLVDFNYPDIIVPICEKQAWAVEDKRNPDSLCYNPKVSDAFLYCDSGKDQCYDRMSPQLSCKRTIPANKWTLETSTLTEHSLEVEGAVTSLHAFEFSSYFAKQPNVPMKGSISIKSGILGLAPARISCRNDTFVQKLKAKYIEISTDGISFFREIPKSSKSVWSVPYHLVPVNVSSVQGKYAFNMVTPTVCGVDVLGWNASAHWTAVIDASQECLMVPQFMVDNIHAWEGGDRKLRFRVDHDSDDWVTIPLGKVCVAPLPQFEDISLTGMYPIIVGSSVIAALSTDGSVGFEVEAPYRIRLTVDDGSPVTKCPVPRPVCKGQQTYFEPRNICIDPVCDDSFVSELDMESRECVWRPVIPYLAYSMIFGYIILELFTFRLQNRAIDIIRTACERSTGESSS